MNNFDELMNFCLDLEEGDTFDGPLDLLLFLVKRSEIDIHDLNISLITSQYLKYLGLMEQFNLTVAGDFLVMAATLTQIKSKMLIPSLRGEGEEPEEDPRMELVRPLVEYARIRSAAEALNSRYILDRDVFQRGAPDDFQEAGQTAEEGPVAKISLFELIEAWRALASRPAAGDRGLNFRLETATIGERLRDVRAFLLAAKSAHFRELDKAAGVSQESSLSFLAVLELAKTGFLKLYQETEDDMSGPRLFLYDPEADTQLDFDYK